ncbi:MAG: hypothetical protein LBQ66_14585 [Planctomycetaceae bacterium]|nr:hypothetical protein [Planctomycetaceae bacterium]
MDKFNFVIVCYFVQAEHVENIRQLALLMWNCKLTLLNMDQYCVLINLLRVDQLSSVDQFIMC